MIDIVLKCLIKLGKQKSLDEKYGINRREDFVNMYKSFILMDYLNLNGTNSCTLKKFDCTECNNKLIIKTKFN